MICLLVCWHRIFLFSILLVFSFIFFDISIETQKSTKLDFSVLAGQIGYALVPMIARGVMLGSDQPVILHMLDIPPAAEALNGVKMELVDAAFPLLKGISNSSFSNSCVYP